MVDLQKEQDVQSSYMVLPAEPNELLCSHCQMPGMVMVRLASVEQLEDWQTLLHSHLDCKPLAGVQVQTWTLIVLREGPLICKLC